MKNTGSTGEAGRIARALDGTSSPSLAQKKKDPTDKAWDKHFDSLFKGGPGNIQDYRYGSW